MCRGFAREVHNFWRARSENRNEKSIVGIPTPILLWGLSANVSAVTLTKGQDINHQAEILKAIQFAKFVI